MPPELKHRVAYRDSKGSVDWLGKVIGSKQSLVAYLKGPVRIRFLDRATLDEHMAISGTPERILQDLAMQKELRLLEAEPWLLAETLAECVLADDPELSTIWPWRMDRDLSNPFAILPGPDAIGLCQIDGEVYFAFCEFKSSSEAGSPPAVMRGPDGMTSQLKKLVTSNKRRLRAVHWLMEHCTTPEHKNLFRAAFGKYNKLDRMNMVLVGVLIRDTAPKASDVERTAVALAQTPGLRWRVSIRAIYLPVPLAELPRLISS